MKYDPAIADKILQDMAGGMTHLKACGEAGISTWIWWEWAVKEPSLSSRYAIARERSAEAMIDGIPDIAELEPDPRRADVKIKSRQWLASKWKRDTYGEKVDVNVNGQIDLVAAISEAKERTMRLGCDQPQTIEAEYEEIQGVEPDSPTDKQSDSADDDIFS